MKPHLSHINNFKPAKEFFIGIDSDGCAFDTMEIKHKECFCPAYINHFNLQPVSKYAREVWEFVNLYSQTRGVNRFKALQLSLDMLGKRPEVIRRGVQTKALTELDVWIDHETKLGNPGLKEEINRTGSQVLKHCLTWSEDVNAAVHKIVRDVIPFPMVHETLDEAAVKADMVVVSATPVDALQREWEEHKIDQHVQCIAGQEMGTKQVHLETCAKGRYEKNHILMIGDAPGDMKAAGSIGALFFPIIPGREEESWEELFNNGIQRFFNLTYEGDYERTIIDRFEVSLPATPPWQ